MFIVSTRASITRNNTCEYAFACVCVCADTCTCSRACSFACIYVHLVSNSEYIT